MCVCICIRDVRYTGTGKVPVYIIFQTVRYHNFAQFGISYRDILIYWDAPVYVCMYVCMCVCVCVYSFLFTLFTVLYGINNEAVYILLFYNNTWIIPGQYVSIELHFGKLCSM